MENTDKTVGITVKNIMANPDSSRKNPKITISDSLNILSEDENEETIFIINFLNKYCKLFIYCQKREALIFLLLILKRHCIQCF